MIEEALQGAGTAHEGVQKVQRRLDPSYYWPPMKRTVQLYLYLPNLRQISQSLKLHGAGVIPLPTSSRGDILAIIVFGRKSIVSDERRR